MESVKTNQMPLRVPASLHHDLKVAAEEEGVSLNQYCLYLLARHMVEPKALASFKGERLLRFMEEASLLQKELNRKRRRSFHETPQETPARRWERLHGED